MSSRGVERRSGSWRALAEMEFRRGFTRLRVAAKGRMAAVAARRQRREEFQWGRTAEEKKERAW